MPRPAILFFVRSLASGTIARGYRAADEVLRFGSPEHSSPARENDAWLVDFAKMLTDDAKTINSGVERTFIISLLFHGLPVALVADGIAVFVGRDAWPALTAQAWPAVIDWDRLPAFES